MLCPVAEGPQAVRPAESAPIRMVCARSKTSTSVAMPTSTSCARTGMGPRKTSAIAVVSFDQPGVAGTWKDLTDSVNAMCGNLTAQVRNIAEVTTAVANGDLSKKITVDVRGEILQLKEAINTMVDQLRSFAGEVTRLVESHPNITIVRERVDALPGHPAIIATGPLTGSQLAGSIAAETSAALIASELWPSTSRSTSQPYASKRFATSSRL